MSKISGHGHRHRAEIMKLSFEIRASPENVPDAPRASADVDHLVLDTVRPPEDTHTDLLYFTTQGGRPVIFENRDGQRLTNKQMLYPPSDHRDYYQVGDVILIYELDKRSAEAYFPELKPEHEDKPSFLFILVKAFLGVKEEKFKIGQKITEIKPARFVSGAGEIKTHLVLFLGKSNIVEMNVEREYSKRLLADNFCMFIYGTKPEVADFLESYCEFLMSAVWGLEKETIGALTKWGAEKAASYAAKKEGKHLIGEWFKSALGKETRLVGRATIQSGEKFSASILTQNDKRNLAAAYPGARVEPLNISSAVSEACLEFAKTIIDDQWEVLLPSITAKLGKWLKVDELAGPTAKQRAIMWFAKKTADALIRKAPIATLDANITAMKESHGANAKEYNELVKKSWEEAVKDFLKDAAKESWESLGEEVTGEDKRADAPASE